MKTLVFCFLALLPTICISQVRAQYPEKAMLVRTIDGDTISVLQHDREVKIRLFGIDCPEKDQPFGDYATGITKKHSWGKI